jgi:uncharacterized membrane protein YdbT with pleckstrin-like domain
MPLKTPTGLTLSAGEEVLWYERRSWKSLWGWFLLCILTIWLFVGIIFLLIAIGIRYGSEYAITNKRAYSRYGLIGRRANDANFDKITDTTFSQGTIGRILNYGDVGINTAGSIGYEIVFRGISDPKSAIVKVQNMKEKYGGEVKKKERIERLYDRYYTGEITREQFEEAKRKIEEE